MKFPALLAAFVAAATAECPSMSDVPLVYSGDIFNCARIYTANGADNAIQACNGCPEIAAEWDSFDGDEDVGTDGQVFPIGSMIVKPGCHFYGFVELNYAGDVSQYDVGIHPNVNAPLGSDHCANGWRSYKCRCEQKFVACEPEDGWTSLFSCDGTEADQEITCKYSLTIGTVYTESVQHSMNVSLDVEAEMTLRFFGLFKDTIGVSAHTGYDWTHASDSTMGHAEKYEVTFTARPGVISRLDQAIGHCGGSDANTEMYKVVSAGKDGEVISEEYFRLLPGGVPIPVRREEAEAALAFDRQAPIA